MITVRKPTPSQLKELKSLENSDDITIHMVRFSSSTIQIFLRDERKKENKNRMHEYGSRGGLRQISVYDDDWDLLGYYDCQYDWSYHRY